MGGIVAVAVGVGLGVGVMVGVLVWVADNCKTTSTMAVCVDWKTLRSFSPVIKRKPASTKTIMTTVKVSPKPVFC